MLEVTFIIEKGCPYAEYEYTKTFESVYACDLYVFNEGMSLEIIKKEWI